MAGEIMVCIIGNLVGDPELRFTPSGSAVANFTIASTPRTYDAQAKDWVDGETTFLRTSVWRSAAENAAESLTKGMRVIAYGKLKSRSYEDKKTQEKRTVMEFEAEEIGPSLQWANVKVNRTQRDGNGGGNRGGGNQNNGGQRNQNQGGQQGGQQGGGFGGSQQGGQRDNTGGNGYNQQEDPWATPGVSNAGGWGNGPDSEPPF